MNINAFLTFRKDYVKIRKRILKRLDGGRLLKFDATGHGEKQLIVMKLRDCKQVRGKVKLEGDEVFDYLTNYSVNILGQFLSTDILIKEKIREKYSNINNYVIETACDQKDNEGNTNYYIIVSIMFNK